MRRGLLPVVVVFMFLVCSSASLAGQKRSIISASVKSFKVFDPSYEQAHVASSISVDPRIPVKSLNSAIETPVLHIDFYAPSSQYYTKVYIVSDTAGTVVSLQAYSDFLYAGFTAFDVDTPLPPGDYTFTSFTQGDNGIAAISDPYKFSVF